MTVMRKQKKASSLRRPYLSSSRKVKVSAIVISTPPYRGILPTAHVIEASVRLLR